jgi:hypothetical protein
MASIGGIDLGEIQSERQTKNAQLFQMPLPLSDSDETVLYDYFGMQRTIEISGIFTGTNAEHVSFINSIEAIMNGQQSGSTFVSSKTSISNTTVYLNYFEWSVNAADVSKINYSLSMIEGA